MIIARRRLPQVRKRAAALQIALASGGGAGGGTGALTELLSDYLSDAVLLGSNAPKA